MHKDPLLIATTILAIVFFSAASFLYSLPTQSAYPEIFAGENGEVLGALEIIEPASFDELPVLNALPGSAEKKIVVPFINNEAAEPLFDFGRAAIMDSASGKILFDKNGNEVSAIASITKLMTAMVFLENNPGFEKEYEISDLDRVNGGKISVYRGDIVTVEDLFYLSLVASDNTATRALVNSSGLSLVEFVEKMNEKARKLNLNKTTFADPVGLSHLNRGSAYEIVKMAKAALEREEISHAVLLEKYDFETRQGKKVSVDSTDALLKSFPAGAITTLGGKTGYTQAAGYCFVGKFIDNEGNEIFTAVLGGPDIAYRFQKSRELAEWTYANYSW